MKRKFVTNLVLIILLNLLIKPFWIFGIDRTVQNLTGAEYGVYAAILSFSFLLNILLDLGITNYNNRNISQNHQLLSKYFANIVMLKLVLALVYGSITLLTGRLVGYRGDWMGILGLLVLNQFLTSFTLYLRSNIAGMQMHTLNSIISVLDRGLMIVMVGVLLWGNVTEKPFRIEWFVYAQTAAYLITMLICFVIVLWKSRFPRFRFDRRFFLVILKQSFPYALLVLLMSGYTRLDVVMLERMLPDGDAQSSIYYHGFRLFDAAYQFALLFAVLLLPMFSKMISERQNIHELTRLSSLLLFVPSIILAVSSFFYREEIMMGMYPPDENELIESLAGLHLSAQSFSLVMFAFLGMAGTIIYGTLLTANGSLRALNITSALALVINLVMNLILIPRWGAPGAALSALVTQGVAGFSQYVVAATRFRMRLDRGLIVRLVIFIGGTFGMGQASLSTGTNWLAGFLGLIAASLLLALLLNLINIKAMVRLVLNKSELK